MPMYEYVCPACHTRFEELRLAKEADDPSPCPHCETWAQRQLSRFSMKRASSETTERRSSTPAHMSGCACCTPARW